MSEFEKKVKISGRALLFSFRSVYTQGASKYFIAVIEKENVIAEFEMITDRHEKWKILDPVPQWIREMELQLVELVLRPYNDDITFRAAKKVRNNPGDSRQQFDDVMPG